MHRWKRSEQSLTNQGMMGGGPREERKDQGERRGRSSAVEGGGEVRCTESPELGACTSSNLCKNHLHPLGAAPPYDALGFTPHLWGWSV